MTARLATLLTTIVLAAACDAARRDGHAGPLPARRPGRGPRPARPRPDAAGGRPPGEAAATEDGEVMTVTVSWGEFAERIAAGGPAADAGYHVFLEAGEVVAIDQVYAP